METIMSRIDSITEIVEKNLGQGLGACAVRSVVTMHHTSRSLFFGQYG